MIRNLFFSSASRQLCQFVVNRQILRVQLKRSLIIRDQLTPNFLSTAGTTKLLVRAMSTGDGRDLYYDDIVKLQTQKDVVLIDVREPDEIKETGLLPGSVHIPLGEVPDALKASADVFKQKYGINKPGQDAFLVFSCRSGKRSRMALSSALEQGYSKSKHYAGGWLDWESKTKN